MSVPTLVTKVRDHLGKARARALMMANAQSAIHRGQYLKELTAELEKAHKILDKIETQGAPPSPA
jgi:hypothetical protein